jgi:photosystem II stability/assembly factor-like uncharacterized protein
VNHIRGGKARHPNGFDPISLKEVPPMQRSKKWHTCLIIGLLVLVLASIAHGEWELVGLDTADYVYAIAFRPGDADTVYAGTDVGVYRSIDGSDTWVLADSVPSANHIAVDPVEKDYVYAAGYQSVFRSADGGETWQRKETGIEFEPWLNFTGMAINPCHPETLYLSGTYDSADGILYRSANRAESWSRQPTPWDPNGVAEVAVDPVRCGRMYSGENWTGPVGRSFDSGITWEATSLSDVPMDIAINPQNTDIVYVCADGWDGRFLYRSEDGGDNWTRLGPEHGITSLVDVVAVNPCNPSFVYVAGDTVYRSTDGGATWAPFSEGLPGDPYNVYSIAVEGELGQTILVGMEQHGIYRRDDSIAGASPGHTEKGSQAIGLRTSPNPMRTQAEIFYSIPGTAHATITVYDVAGRPVRRLLDKRMDAGRHFIHWNCRTDTGARVSPGIYLLRIKAAGSTEETKIVVSK